MFEDLTPAPDRAAAAEPAGNPPPTNPPDDDAAAARSPHEDAVLASVDEPAVPPTSAANGYDEGEEIDESADQELDDWKEALRRDFETWLAELDEPPAWDTGSGEVNEAPDLYSFYQQLTAGNAENRKANRRTAEAISLWGDTLLRFESTLAPLRESVTALAAAQPKGEQLSRAQCLVLIELLDRMQRIATAFAAPPPKTAWWGRADASWRNAWEAQRGGLAILVSHFEALLAQAEVTRIEALHQPFDPTVMTAVATTVDPTRPAQTVVEELTAGYRRSGELLRPAQVKVTRRG